MTSWADRWASVWLDTTLAAVLVTGFAALAMIQCRQPARRRTWGRLGLLASLVVVPLAAFCPLPKVDLGHPSRALWMVEPRPTTPDLARSADLDRASRWMVAPGGRSEAVDLRTPRPRRLWSKTILRGLMLLYGCGLVVGLIRLILGVVGSAYLIRRAWPASDRAVRLLRTLPFAGRLGRRPRLKISKRAGRPVLIGFARSVILIPPELDQPGLEPQLRLGLLHELAHAEVADHRFGLVAALAHSVWFFLPHVWWVRNQLRLDAEFLADHRAVGHFGTSYNYAESLVGLASHPISTVPTVRPSAPVEAGAPRRAIRAGELASALLQRVQMLLKCPFEVEDRPPWSWSAGVVALVVATTLGASRLSIRDGRERTAGLAGGSVDQACRAFHLAELVIAPPMLGDQPFDLRFRLPDEFRLACEILAEPAELGSLEILGYRLGPLPETRSNPTVQTGSAWRRVEIVRQSGGLEAVHIDGTQVVSTHRPSNPASWLTIRPIPGRTTRLRDLRLTF